MQGVVVAQAQDLALVLVEAHPINVVPPIQSIQVSLQSLPVLMQIDTPA